jgi:hypothetical protein
LEYVPGSHRWLLTETPAEFHAASDYEAPMLAAARLAGVDNPARVFVEVPRDPARSTPARCGTGPG